MSFQQHMKGLRTKYEAGDKSALALALWGCARLRRPLPSWVAEAWQVGWFNVTMRTADWNDLLGTVKVKTPKQIERERVKQEQLGKLVKLRPSVRAPIERDSEGAFRELGEKMGIAPRAVRELYYTKFTYDGEEIRVLSPLIMRRRNSKK